jgi:hypothetical protein
MTESTASTLVAWNGETYRGAGDWYDKFTNDPEFLEYTEDLDHDEILRLALFAYNTGCALVPEDLFLLIAQEQEAFQGEHDSEAEFAEDFFTSTGQLDEEATKWLVIDWQATYNYALRFDYFAYDVVDINGSYRKFFWSSNV